MAIRMIFFLLCAIPTASPWLAAARAATVDELLSDPKLEARARNLSAELRCMVCQNQSIDDSDAPLAKDLRILVRERLAAGDNDDEVRAFLVARYGDFILLKPPLKTQTALLWATPILVMAAGALGLAFFYRRRRIDGQPALMQSLSEEELAELKEATDAAKE